MKRRTAEKIDGAAMVIGAMLAPLGVWAQAGARTDFASLVVVGVASVGAGLAAVRLWVARDPRAVVPPPLPPVDPR